MIKWLICKLRGHCWVFEQRAYIVAGQLQLWRVKCRRCGFWSPKRMVEEDWVISVGRKAQMRSHNPTWAAEADAWAEQVGNADTDLVEKVEELIADMRRHRPGSEPTCPGCCQWAAMEAEADADLAAGRWQEFGDVEELIANLKGISNKLLLPKESPRVSVVSDSQVGDENAS